MILLAQEWYKMSISAQILATVPEKVIQAAASLKLLVLDVDGVLTDGQLFFSEEGEMLKAFNIQDGLGIKLLQSAGVQVGIITGRTSASLKFRAEELGISFITQGRADKLPVLEERRLLYALELYEIGFLGDDLPDMKCIQQVGLGICVANSNIALAQLADWQTEKTGGSGAVREVADLILAAQGKLDQIISRYL